MLRVSLRVSAKRAWGQEATRYARRKAHCVRSADAGSSWGEFIPPHPPRTLRVRMFTLVNTKSPCLLRERVNDTGVRMLTPVNTKSPCLLRESHSARLATRVGKNYSAHDIDAHNHKNFFLVLQPEITLASIPPPRNHPKTSQETPENICSPSHPRGIPPYDHPPHPRHRRRRRARYLSRSLPRNNPPTNPIPHRLLLRPHRRMLNRRSPRARPRAQPPHRRTRQLLQNLRPQSLRQKEKFLPVPNLQTHLPHRPTHLRAPIRRRR